MMNETTPSNKKADSAGPNISKPLSPNQVLIKKVHAEVRRNPTPQLIVLLRVPEIVLKSEESGKNEA